jgi:hypothetical protein
MPVVIRCVVRQLRRTGLRSVEFVPTSEKFFCQVICVSMYLGHLL